MHRDPKGEKRPADASSNSKRRPVTPSVKRQITALYAKGNGIGLLRIAALLDIDTATVQRVVNHEEPEQVI